MEENKDKAPARKSAERKPAGQTAAQRRAAAGKKRADDERRKAREERQALAREKARLAKEKAAMAKAEKARREEAGSRELHSLATESGSYDTTLNRMFLGRRPWVAEAPKKIRSFMPGTVEQLMVKAGDEVREDDVLMIFRAMKMNNRMLSPVGGRVAAVNVAEGDNVPKNTVMIELS